MVIDKKKIIRNICYTELVYGRINKKLKVHYSKNEIEELIFNLLKNTSEIDYSRVGKNYYITNIAKNIRVTVNSNTYRVITVDRLKEETL
ncbi:MAG: DUF3781 domain-containing protein [Candidatus Cloacimonetes bacterium]|nr:DUF3781 domain-containing protein [Candidatus Cloacimonadota bacterium]